jgi:hypothetical protein
MSAEAKGTFQVKEWGEKPFGEEPGAPKMTRASLKATFSGDLDGEGATEYVMIYREDGSATFVGLTRIVGRLGQREGTFVLQCAGTFDARTHIAKCDWTVVPNSGTEDFRGLSGKGCFEAPGIQAEYSLNYDLA